jgi:hypothetical protein
MKRILFALFALAAVALAACRQYDVDVYKNLNGRVWGGAGTGGVSQSFTCTADSLLWADIFIGAANDSGRQYQFDILTGPNGSALYTGDTLAGPDIHYSFVRARLRPVGPPPIKGETYVLQVTITNAVLTDSINWYADPTDPYKYGMFLNPPIQGQSMPLTWDLCARIEGINRPVSRESAEKPVSRPDLSIDSVWVTQGANAQVTLHARVRNIGAREFASAKKGCWVQFAIDGDSVGAIAGPAKLNAGSIALVQSVSVSPDRSIMHLVSAIANPDKEVTEPNFDNNARYCPLFAR